MAHTEMRRTDNGRDTVPVAQIGLSDRIRRNFSWKLIGVDHTI